MGHHARLLRDSNRFEGGAIAAVGEIDQHTEVVHLRHHVFSQSAQAGVGPFPEGIANAVAVTMGQLQHSELLLEELSQVDQIGIVHRAAGHVQNGGVLTGQHHGELPLCQRGIEVVGPDDRLKAAVRLSECRFPGGERLERIGTAAWIDRQIQHRAGQTGRQRGGGIEPRPFDGETVEREEGGGSEPGAAHPCQTRQRSGTAVQERTSGNHHDYLHIVIRETPEK